MLIPKGVLTAQEVGSQIIVITQILLGMTSQYRHLWRNLCNLWLIMNTFTTRSKLDPQFGV
jgi:hypothetical protein